MRHRSIVARLSQPGSARLLALVRAALGIHLATVFASPSFGLLAAVGGRPHPMTATYFPPWLEESIARAIEPLALLGLALACLMAVGLATRVVVPALFVVFVATQNYWFRSTLFHDDWLYFTFPLLVLSFARAADAWSADAWIAARRGARPSIDPVQYRWPVEAIVGWFAFLYVAAGLAKLFPLAKGIVWLSGVSAQEFAVEFVRDSPVYWVLGRAPFDYGVLWPFTIGSVATVAVELSAGALLFTERHRVVVFGAILGLHLSIFCLGIPAFPQMALALGVALIPPERFADARDGGTVRHADP